MDVRSPIPPFEESTITIEGDRMDEALQYGPTIGHKDLLSVLTKMQVENHGRAVDPSWRISVGAGSQDLLYKVFQTLTDPGDVVLVEAPTYAGVIPNLISRQADCVEVPVDGEGIVASALEEMLANWPWGKKMPKYLYTIPYGCNPSGATASLERRVKVLELARKYKFLILEDDPYYLLYYGDAPRPASYFELEGKDGHPTGIVLRFDSLSKVVSSGLRIGFATGPIPLLTKMDLLTQSANLQPSSTAMSIAMALLTNWGVEGFKAHCYNVSQFYKGRRDVFEKALNKHLPGLVEYTSPVSGLFLWFKLKIPPPVDDLTATEGDSHDLIRNKAFANGVLALPGTVFFASGKRTAYVRASFSVLNDEDTDEALRRLGEVVKQARAEAA
ncbi:TdiD protein [Clavulina sp. PMI_390]|nr:TdiD protein [Clavulina sp. PMI_390]